MTEPITHLRFGMFRRRWRIVNVTEGYKPWPQEGARTVVTCRRGDDVRTRGFSDHIGHLFEVASEETIEAVEAQL